jgi:hypothetical protein
MEIQRIVNRLKKNGYILVVLLCAFCSQAECRDTLFNQALENWSKSFIVFERITKADTVTWCSMTYNFINAVIMEEKLNKQNSRMMAIQFAAENKNRRFHFLKKKAIKLLGEYSASAYDTISAKFGKLTKQELREMFKARTSVDSCLQVCRTSSEIYALARLLFEKGLLP